MLTDAESDLPVFAKFPRRHWRPIWSTNPQARVNKEIKLDRAGFRAVFFLVTAFDHA